MGKLTHLKAFMSDDGKRGRAWVDENGWAYKRTQHNQVVYCMLKDVGGHREEWSIRTKQVAAEEGAVTWADEPKALTPAEALRALADGKCISRSAEVSEKSVIKFDEKFGMMNWTRDYHDFNGFRGSYYWDVSSITMFIDFRIVPDPSQEGK